jgi:hypothetical protein
MTPEQVALRAFNIILEVMQKGSDKEGSNDTWLDKPDLFHVDKAARHIINDRLDGNEPHLHYALVRIIMAICQGEKLP